MKRPEVEEFKRLCNQQVEPWGMSDHDTVELCDYILLLERRARMAKLYITDDKPETARAALDGTYDNDR